MTTNSTKKLTQKDYFAMLSALVEESDHAQKDELLAFIDKRVEALAKKASTPTKAQKENEGIMDAIVEALVFLGKPVTCSELMKVEELSAHSNQKLSALLRKLVESGQVTKTVEKKVSYFSV